ncbi:cupin domain-containing protein [Halorarius halobius]|uniref:cupin domain-containing protein n=1 Tax=Halorarius halobius TaxID=2962671 RepID=UPI0020CF18A3|nr:cupin domain-containing protein [Halorarius halobius]
MEVSRLEELEPNWNLPEADVPGHMRNIWVHVDGETGASNQMLGLARQPPGNGMPGFHEHEAEETYYVLEGKAAFWTDTDEEVIVERHESAYFPPGEKHSYRNAGTDDLLMLWALSGAEETMRKEYEVGYEADDRYEL